MQYEETEIGEIDVGQEEILYTISGEPAASVDTLYYALVDSWEDYVENPITFPYTAISGSTTITIPTRRYLIFSPSKSGQTVQDGAIVYYNSASSMSANVICSNIGGSWSIEKKATGAFTGDVIQYRATITEQQEKWTLIGPVSGTSKGPYLPCAAAPLALWQPFGSALPRYQGPGLFRRLHPWRPAPPEFPCIPLDFYAHYAYNTSEKTQGRAAHEPQLS